MKKALWSMVALSALAAGAPASAQYQNGRQTGSRAGDYRSDYNDDYGVAGNADFSARIVRLQAQLDAEVRSGEIERRDAWRIRQQLTQLSQLERRYGVNGFTGQERSDLQQRLRAVREELRATGAGYGPNRGYDRGDRYSDRDRDGRYDADERMDANGDGYDDRDGNRDGRRDDDAGRPVQMRGGVGGVIDQMIGGGSLRVGDRATSDLGGVPYEARGRYRDTDSAYYRSDGRWIYRIDARTRTVAQVYPIGR